MTRWIAAMVAGALLGTRVVAAPLAAFGHLPTVDLVALSPDGTQVAMIVGDARGRQIQVRRVADHGVVDIVNVGVAKVRGLVWAGDHHVAIERTTAAEVFQLSGPKREWALALDLDLRTKKLSPLLAGEVAGAGEMLNTVNGALMPRVIDGKPVLFVVGETFPDSHGVATLFRIDLDSRRTAKVVIGNVDTRGWVVDAAGAVVARTDYIQTTGRWILWTARGHTMVRSMTATDPLDTPSLEGLGRTPGTVMVADTADDTVSYREVALGGETVSEPIAALAGGDLVTDPRSGLVIGITRDDALRTTYTFLDPADAKLWASVARGFRDAVVHLESWSDDRKTMVLRVEGKAFGAAYYLLDVATRHASWLANQYAEIEADDLGIKTSFDYKAADGLTIPAYLTLPPGHAASKLPLVVLAHGGPGARDEPGFDWWAQALASRGYAVLQPQFRGSTGFGEAFHSAGFGEWGKKMQTDLSDGVRHLATQGTIDPKRVCIVGGSYGGYAAMAGVALQHDVYRCAVAVAGVADLRAMLAAERDATNGSRNHAMRFWQRFMGAKSAFDPALDALSPARHAGDVAVPLLLIHGVDDTVVPISQSKLMAAAMKRAGKPVEFVTLTGEDHWLSRSESRTAMLDATAKFLSLNLPVDAAAR